MTIADEPQLGAHHEAAGVRFAAWSDRATQISVVLYDEPDTPGREVALSRTASAQVFAAFVPDLQPGALYNFRVDGSIAVDPYARALPFGVHGPAQVVPHLLARVHPSRPIQFDGREVFYELHVGAFTPEGTFASAAERLSELRELGVTTLELMPITAFPGARGWGYDGVGLFAPFAGYGSRDQLSAFIDAAHSQGLSVVLDVVYNHLGPDGNALPTFSESYFAADRQTPWGAAPALEKPAFRRLILDNADYWLNTLGFDGLRLDATHELEPGGQPHILSELAQQVHARSADAVLIAEDNRNDPQLLLGRGIDAVWSDDFHHSVHVLLTHERDGYYAAYRSDLADLARIIEHGQLNEHPASLEPAGRVPLGRRLFALQNHDQIGNRAFGERLHELSGLPLFHAASLLLLFLPPTPLLFMGQEWAASSPFLYFSHHRGALGHAVSQGRRREFQHFSRFRELDPERIPDPQAQATFQASKLDWTERHATAHASTLELYRRALELRRTDAVLSQPSTISAGSGAGLLWVLRRTRSAQRLLIFNPHAAQAPTEVAGYRASQARPLLSSHTLHVGADSFQLAASSTTIFSLSEDAGRPS